jgi:hypothetical protein
LAKQKWWRVISQLKKKLGCNWGKKTITSWE